MSVIERTEIPIGESSTSRSRTWSALADRIRVLNWQGVVVEWVIIIIVALLYSSSTLLNFDPRALQQTGEHSESATLPLLAEIGLNRYGEIPLWNHYMLTGYPHTGDTVSHFWHPVSTIPIMIWGGVNGMKVSILFAFMLAGIGQWLFGQVFGLRGIVRLWSALTYMMSGGLALLWRLGWYELLLGMVWFPWCFAAVWWAMQRRDRASLGIAALPIAMVITTGGGYYPFYLGVCVMVLVGMSILLAPSGRRWPQFRRASAIAVLAIGALAVVLLPLVDGYRLSVRLVPPDINQEGSQPIPYALVNYIVSNFEWYGNTVLGQKGGWNWFYFGALPLFALLFVPMAFRTRRYRVAVITISVLALIVLAWASNRYTPVGYLYKVIPFLLLLRFPNRLLIVATSPLLILAGLGLQYLYESLKRRSRGFAVGLSIGRSDQTDGLRWPIATLVTVLFGVFLFTTVRDVYAVNKPVAFAEGRLDPKSYTALGWLRNHDPDLYYVNVGGGATLYQWTTAMYDYEMPMINFEYGRVLESRSKQRQPDSPFIATPKYQFSLPGQPHAEAAQKINDFGGMELWYDPRALPFAFYAPTSLLQSNQRVTLPNVKALEARFDGPNRIVVTGNVPDSHQVVVLVSDYPGWTVAIDGQPSTVTPVNGYLGAKTTAGDHTLTFSFRPMDHYIGLVISLVTLAIIGLVIVVDSGQWLFRARSQRGL